MFSFGYMRGHRVNLLGQGWEWGGGPAAGRGSKVTSHQGCLCSSLRIMPQPPRPFRALKHEFSVGVEAGRGRGNRALGREVAVRKGNKLRGLRYDDVQG